MEDFIAQLQDLRYLDWTDRKLSVGTPGCFLKAYEEKNGTRFYFIGAKSLEYNLGLIPRERQLFPGKLGTGNAEMLFRGLQDVLPKVHLRKIREMLWRRWERYVEICN